MSRQSWLFPEEDDVYWQSTYALAITIVTASTAEDCLSCMAQYYRLFPGEVCLGWLQPEFFIAVPVVKFTPYTVSAGPCGLLACILFSLLCGHRGLALGDPGLWRFR